MFDLDWYIVLEIRACFILVFIEYFNKTDDIFSFYLYFDLGKRFAMQLMYEICIRTSIFFKYVVK